MWEEISKFWSPEWWHKQIPYWGPRNISRRIREFSRPRDLSLGRLDLYSRSVFSSKITFSIPVPIATENFILLRYDATSLGKQLKTFRKEVVCSQRLEPLAQRQSVTSQKTRIVSLASLRTRAALSNVLVLLWRATTWTHNWSGGAPAHIVIMRYIMNA